MKILEINNTSYSIELMNMFHIILNRDFGLRLL